MVRLCICKKINFLCWANKSAWTES